MNEREALDRMVSPGMRRPNKPHQGVMQIWITRACNLACFHCTQGSNLSGKPGMMTVEQFAAACDSLRDYFGVIGVFGGNPTMSPHFEAMCEVFAAKVPFERRGLWCNHPLGKGAAMRKTFNPAVSNLNVHLDREAFDEFKRDWPESRPFGLTDDSRHSPVYVSLADVVPDEAERWRLISGCPINRHWSALVGVFRGELRGWFCEIAGAQAMLRQNDPNCPDTGVAIEPGWWNRPMSAFAAQVRQHCHRCGVPLNGYGELAQKPDAEGVEQISQEYADIAVPKRKGRRVEVVTDRAQLKEGRIGKVVDYLQNAKK